jgi:hypothetical protein
MDDFLGLDEKLTVSLDCSGGYEKVSFRFASE